MSANVAEKVKNNATPSTNYFFTVVLQWHVLAGKRYRYERHYENKDMEREIITERTNEQTEKKYRRKQERIGN
jgi:hypothetical protein